MAEVTTSAMALDPFKLSDFLHQSSGMSGSGLDGQSPQGDVSADNQNAGSDSLTQDLRELAQVFAAILQALESEKSGKSPDDSLDPAMQASSGDGQDDASPSMDGAGGGMGGVGGGDAGGGSSAPSGVQTPATPSDAAAMGGPAGAGARSAPATTAGDAPDSAGQASTSAGSGPNTTVIKNTSTHDEKIGEFLNGGSTTDPSASIDLKPGQTGALHYQNGQGGFDAEADSQGQFQSTASRLEFYADANGKNNDDVSDIDGDNAAITVNDGHGKSAGESKSIAGNAPSDLVTKDAGGLPTVAGFYDGSTATMQKAGQFQENQFNGSGNVYIHPDDDRNGAGQNPMTMAQDSQQTYYATFGNA